MMELLTPNQRTNTMKIPSTINLSESDMQAAIKMWAENTYDGEFNENEVDIQTLELGGFSATINKKIQEPVTDRKTELNYLVINGVCYGKVEYEHINSHKLSAAIKIAERNNKTSIRGFMISDYANSLDHNAVSESDYKAVMEFEGTTQPDNCYDPSKEIPISLTTLGYWRNLAIQGKAATLKDLIDLNIDVIENK